LKDYGKTTKHHGKSGKTSLFSLLRKNSTFLIGLSITLISLYIFQSKINFAEIYDQFKNINFLFLFFGIIALLTGYILRIFRWSYILSTDSRKISMKSCFSAYMGSIALNNTLPLRAGDIIRLIVFPAVMKISKSQSGGSFLIERMFDIIVLTIMLSIFLSISSKSFGAFINPYIYNIPLILGISIFCWLMFVVIIKIFKSKIKEFTNKIRYMLRLDKLFFAFLLSIAVWTCEAGLFFNILLSLGVDFDFPTAIFITSLITLGTLIPSAPGYFGTFHIIGYSVLINLGESSLIAGSFAIISHTILWTLTTIIGLLAMIFNLELFRGFKINWMK